jgi:acyl-CoA synthetase (AMP-forming)/AMP-acid ligase II/acyl carrier protein
MSLVQHLKGLAAHQPEALLYGWFERSPTGITLKRSYTYREAWDRVQALAHALISKAHIQPGDRILLCYPPCIDFLFAFLGCMLADAVPVPSYPPNPQALKATIPAFAKVKQLTDAKIVLTNRQYRKWTSLSIFAEWPSGLRWITTDSLFAVGLHLSHDIPCPQVTPEDLAFLQFTSGSTGDPKGVMISHGVIWESFRGMTAGQATRIRPAYPPSVGRVAVTPNTSEISPFTMVSWLPLYHDLGLILAALMPIYRAGNAFLGSPLDFVAQPTSWLIAISQFRANASAAPNFAFDLVRKRWQKMPESMRPKIDLSCVKLIVNGGEPIRKATLEKFAATFHQQGFRAEALCPSYGMAECTVAACAEHSTELVSSTLRPDLVSSGSNFQESGMLVGILKQDWRTVKDLQITADGEVGEIAVTGNALSSGYWGATKLSNFIGRDDLPSELQDLAALHPDIRSDCWYVTGDLGMLEHGHLFVTGRIKDLIIIRGRNYVATDLQTTVMESIPEVRPGCIAAIAVPHGNSSSEEALLLCETRSVLSNAEGNVIIKNIQRCVRDAHGIQVHVALLKKGCLPKTSSGKLQRSKTSQMWQTQAFKPLAMSLETENSFEKTPKTSSTDSVFQSSHTSVDVLLSNPSAIMDELSLAWDPRADYSRRFSALSTQIIRIIQSNLPIEEDARNEQPSVTVESVFTELGLDSISAATILQNAQDEANHILVMKKFEPIMLRPSLLFEHLDVNSLVQYLISISASIPDNILEHKSESLKDKTRDIRELPRQTTTNHYIFFLVAQGLWICIIWAIILHAARLSVSLVSLCGPLYRLLTILIGHFVFLLMLATLVVVLKKYIIGTFETGVHPLYGPYHLRFWMVESAVRCLDLVGMTSFHDTIVYETFLAAMGVSISPGATINTSINTAFDLLSIGRHSIVARSSTIQCHNYQMQCLVLGRVSIDELVVIDERAVIQISGTAWNHESSIPQSYQPETTHIALPTPEVIGGSSTLRPCRRHGTRVRSHLPSSPNIWYEMSNVPAIRWLYAFVLFVLSDAAVAIASIFSVSAVTRLFGLKFAEGNYLGIFPFVFGPHIFGPNKALLERINGNLAFETTILSENSVSGPVSFVPETGVTWCLLSSTVTYFFWILSMAFITIVVQHLLVPPPMHGGVVHGHSYSGAVRQFYGNLMRRLHSQASFLTTGKRRFFSSGTS